MSLAPGRAIVSGPGTENHGKKRNLECIFWISGNFGGFVLAGPLRASGLIVLSGLCVLSMKMCDAI